MWLVGEHARVAELLARDLDGALLTVSFLRELKTRRPRRDRYERDVLGLELLLEEERRKRREYQAAFRKLLEERKGTE